MRLQFKNISLLLIIGSILLASCAEDFLDLKSDKRLVIPATLDDLQALLDHTTKMNILMPSLGEVASDDYYITQDRYNALALPTRLAYIWASIPEYTNNESTDWNGRYEQIFYCNIVLNRLENWSLEQHSEERSRYIKGSALFYRAWAYFHLSQIFCKPYNTLISNEDLGLPLRLSDDINDRSVRSTVEETYQQMITDLKAATELLPTKSTLATRPDKVAAYALLARIYLQMAKFDEAALHSQEALNISDVLMDYRDVDDGQTYPFHIFNDEVIFHSELGTAVGLVLRENRLLVDTILYKSYSDHDLRKGLFFYMNDGVRFRGSYKGGQDMFCGISTAELYLTLSESLCRLGNSSGAIDSMHKLLSMRYVDDSYDLDHLVGDKERLLNRILEERRKELIYRGIRWGDIRRLNVEGADIRLVRKIGEDIYTLEPDDDRSVFPIPHNVIISSGIPQN